MAHQCPRCSVWMDVEAEFKHGSRFRCPNCRAPKGLTRDSNHG